MGNIIIISEKQTNQMTDYSAINALGDPNQAVFFGTMGVVSALVFANLGAAYGTAKSGVGIVSVAVLKPDLLFRGAISKVPYTQSSIEDPNSWTYDYYTGYKQLGAGLCCGLSSLAAGLCIGVVGDAGVRGNAQRDILIALILMMIFSEALALYGFIVAIVLSSA